MIHNRIYADEHVGVNLLENVLLYSYVCISRLYTICYIFFEIFIWKMELRLTTKTVDQL